MSDWDTVPDRTCGRINPADPLRSIDTASISACTYIRAGDNQTLAGPEYFAIMKSRSAKLFGWRLCLTTTSTLVPDTWQLALVAPHEGKSLTAWFANSQGLEVFADGAFHDPDGEYQPRRARNVPSRRQLMQALALSGPGPDSSPHSRNADHLRRVIERRLTFLRLEPELVVRSQLVFPGRRIAPRRASDPETLR